MMPLRCPNLLRLLSFISSCLIFKVVSLEMKSIPLFGTKFGTTRSKTVEGDSKKRNTKNKKMIQRWMEERTCARMRTTLGKFWYQNLVPKGKNTKRFLNSCPFGERKRRRDIEDVWIKFVDPFLALEAWFQKGWAVRNL
ncbi:hypothetical protein OIU84_021158 [Salix udensis]|uniref:Uncharacterized protein n=1 Tax=Salix udensis TaxID=889485 RepID=A0AAD6KU99_9ROSI|nr:hypothetical protein OIU84_021158 [Salix udensis]